MLVLGVIGVLAYLLTPLVDRLEAFLPRSRPTSASGL
jgi:predicted PurR-regulated permease PerM